MKSPWHRGQRDDQHTPVEMRFIDMFMTALGSLVFLALLLAFLLPKTTQSEIKDEDVERLKKENQKIVAENQHLRRQIQLQQQASPADTTKTEDADIMKRWFGILLLTSGCPSSEPELYARYEGKLFNVKTGELVPDAEQFDASDVAKKSTFFGNRYFDIGKGTDSATTSQPILKEVPSIGLDRLNKAGLHAKLFYGIHRGADALWSVYVGLRDPIEQGDRECIVEPIYLSYPGLIPGDKIVMTQLRPFAWLRRFKVNLDGTTTFGTLPRGDEQFKSDLAEFSKKQSQILCEKKSICDTIDAHLALLDPSALPPLKKMSGGTTESIPGREHKYQGRAQYQSSGRHHLLRRQRQPR